MARSSKATTADILAKFPGPVTLYPSKLHLVHLFLVSTIFFVSGILFLRSGGNSGFERAVLIGCVIMGGLGAPISALAFLPRAAFLRLDKAGFEYANCFYRRHYAWRDVKDFHVWVGPYGVRNVGFRAPWWRGHFFTGILPDPYGFTVDETTALMDSWQKLAIPSLSTESAPNKAALSGPHGVDAFVNRAEKFGRMFAHVTTMQWVGMAIVGLSFIAALIVFFTSTHAPQLAGQTAEPSPPTDILSDHGPKRVACDFKWSTLQQPDPGSYQEFLQNCMKGKESGSP